MCARGDLGVSARCQRALMRSRRAVGKRSRNIAGFGGRGCRRGLRLAAGASAGQLRWESPIDSAETGHSSADTGPNPIEVG